MKWRNIEFGTEIVRSFQVNSDIRIVFKCCWYRRLVLYNSRISGWCRFHHYCCCFVSDSYEFFSMSFLVFCVVYTTVKNIILRLVLTRLIWCIWSLKFGCMLYLGENLRVSSSITLCFQCFLSLYVFTVFIIHLAEILGLYLYGIGLKIC